VGVIFGLFETGMPILVLVLGRSLATTLGHAAHWMGAALLLATGGYAVIQAIGGPARHDGQEPATPAGQRTGRLLATGGALSIGNLAVGFALGTFHVSLALAAVVIGVVSAAMSLIGLERQPDRNPGRGPRRAHRRPGADRRRDRGGQRHHLAPSR